jgi:hypothetical protein
MAVIDYDCGSDNRESRKRGNAEDATAHDAHVRESSGDESALACARVLGTSVRVSGSP